MSGWRVDIARACDYGPFAVDDLQYGVRGKIVGGDDCGEPGEIERREHHPGHVSFFIQHGLAEIHAVQIRNAADLIITDTEVARLHRTLEVGAIENIILNFRSPGSANDVPIRARQTDISVLREKLVDVDQRAIAHRRNGTFNFGKLRNAVQELTRARDETLLFGRSQLNQM